MKLRAKILILLLGAIIPVIVFFATIGIYFFNDALKKESVKSHKLMYSVFMPAISIYLWEFDVDRIKETISNIMNNNYASDVYLYDTDGSFILGRIKDKEKKTIIDVNDDYLSEYEFSLKNVKKYINQNKTSEESSLFEIENDKSRSTVIGVLYHKSLETNKLETIGYAIFHYEIKEIETIIKKAIIIIIIISFLITVILVILLSILLKEALIRHIILLNRASLTIAIGKKRIIKEKRGKDEIAELIRNFNIMTNQIFQNQENLQLISEEGIKISSCFTLSSLLLQIRDSIEKISKNGLLFNLYISSKLVDDKDFKGFIKINFIDNEIAFDFSDSLIFGNENKVPPDCKRIFIRNNIEGHICALIDLKNPGDKNQMTHLIREEKIFRSVQTLQISVASAMSTMNFIREQKEQLRLVGEQETARVVQLNLLPKNTLKKIFQYQVTGHFEPASECAGDWWNTYILPDKRLLILLGDVTGHGLGSAILTAVVKGFCDALHHKLGLSANHILSELNDAVLNTGKKERVMTMFAAILNPELNTIEYSNAGQNFPFIIKNAEAQKGISKLIAHGPALGYKAESSNKDESKFTLHVTEFKKGDTFFLFSDGLTEAANKDGLNFSDRKLKNILEENKEANLEELKENLLKKFREFTQNTTLTDDVTFVICRYV